jgi:hypothetical protein
LRYSAQIQGLGKKPSLAQMLIALFFPELMSSNSATKKTPVCSHAKDNSNFFFATNEGMNEWAVDPPGDHQIRS